MPVKKVVLLTSGQPALNPRLVKEADALTAAGFNVLVIYVYWNAWGTTFDAELFKTRKWQAIRVGGDPYSSSFIFLLSRVLHKISIKITRLFRNTFFRDWAIARGSYFLIREAKKHEADLYIGHNLGALPALIKTAEYYGKPCGFDAEDFHRAETTDGSNDFDFILKAGIEGKYLPRLNYLSVSSPGIGKAYQALFPHKVPVTILNVFPVEKGEISPKPAEPGIVKLFWFSQTISLQRGVNDCVKSLRLINKPGIELHLLGLVDESTKCKLKEDRGDMVRLVFHEPVSPDNIISFAHNFDIGLAMEDGVPFNRDICLTNKIFTYMQAGLAVVASDTRAQSELMAKYPEAGKIYKKNNLESLAQVISEYLDNPGDLYKAKEASLKIGRGELNWENESARFIGLVKGTLAG